MTICDRCNAKDSKICNTCKIKGKVIVEAVKKPEQNAPETVTAISKLYHYLPEDLAAEAILAEFGSKKEPIKLIERESGLYLRDNHGECKISIDTEKGSIEKIIAHISAKAKRIYSYEPVRGLNWKWAENCRTDSLGCAKAGLA